MQISVSRLRAYTQCPMRYRLRYIEVAEAEFVSSNLVFGSAIHHAIAEFHTSFNTIDPAAMYTEFLKYWDAQVAECERTHKQLRIKGNERELLDLALALCEVYIKQFWDLIVDSQDNIEILFDVPLFDPQSGFGKLDHSLVGKIDLVVNSDIYEFKTASRAASQNDADASIQLTAYSLAYQFLYDEPPENLYLVSLVKTKRPKIQMLKTERSGQNYVELIEMASQIARAIELGLFFKNRETLYGCGSCEYEKRCRFFSPNNATTVSSSAQ